MADGLPRPRRRLAVAALSLGTSLVIIDGAIAAVALPTIARALDVDAASAVLVVAVYQLCTVMTVLPFSALGDRIGHRRLYQFGQLCFALATMLVLFAQSLPLLLCIRAAQALAASAVLSVSMAMIRATYPAGQLGRGIGTNSVVVQTSAALAPSLCGLILAFADWPWVFAVAAPLALASLLLGRALPDPVPGSEPFDFRAALVCSASIGLVIVGIGGTSHGVPALVSVGVLALGVIVATRFVRRELKKTRPILPLDLLATPALALSVLGALTAFIASTTIILSTPFRLQHEYGFTAAEVGLALGSWPLSTILVAPLAGMLADRYPAGLLGAAGMLVASGALAALVMLPATPDWIDVGWRLALCGSGFALFLAPNTRLLISSAPRERAASAGGLVSTTRLIGQTLAATLVAGLFAAGAGGSTPLLLAAGFAVATGVCSAARVPRRLGKRAGD